MFLLMLLIVMFFLIFSFQTIYKGKFQAQLRAITCFIHPPTIQPTPSTSWIIVKQILFHLQVFQYISK